MHILTEGKKMSRQHRSISQQLNKTKKLEIRQKILSNWLNEWQAEHNDLIASLNIAIADMDFERLEFLRIMAREITDKKIVALRKILI